MKTGLFIVVSIDIILICWVLRDLLLWHLKINSKIEVLEKTLGIMLWIFEKLKINNQPQENKPKEAFIQEMITTLREFELENTPDGKQVTFSIRFVKKNGELFFVPRSVAAGLRFSMRENRMRGTVPADSYNNSSFHVKPVYTDGNPELN